MTPFVAGILWAVAAVAAVLLPGFYAYSSASTSTKLSSFVVLCGVAVYYQYLEPANTLLAELNGYTSSHPYKTLAIMLAIGIPFSRAQQKLRFARVDRLMNKYGFTDDPKSYNNMAMEVAQEVEANMAEYEFPILYQFAWISDFLRHHRYGVWINSDDILYLIIHFAMIPGHWINRFGYRKLEPFEEHALWVLWREIGCMMGCRYMPQELSQAKLWRKNFENKCRWRCPENEEAGMAMLNEIVYTCPSLFKPLLRKVVVSILDWDIVFYCQMDKLGRSSLLRFLTFRVFDLCGWFILHFGLPRLSPYKRTFQESKKKSGVVHIVPTPYDTLPFYQARTFWNLWGYSAIIRTVLGLPAPSPIFYSDGVLVEAMGAAQISHESQVTVEKKVREKAAILEKSPPGYRPAIAYQANRLLAPVAGPEYGMVTNRYPPGTVVIPAGSDLRFDKKWEQRIAGYSKVNAIEKPEDIIHFDPREAYGGPDDGGLGVSTPQVCISA